MHNRLSVSTENEEKREGAREGGERRKEIEKSESEDEGGKGRQRETETPWAVWFEDIELLDPFFT